MPRKSEKVWMYMIPVVFVEAKIVRNVNIDSAVLYMQLFYARVIYLDITPVDLSLERGYCRIITCGYIQIEE